MHLILYKTPDLASSEIVLSTNPSGLSTNPDPILFGISNFVKNIPDAAGKTI